MDEEHLRILVRFNALSESLCRIEDSEQVKDIFIEIAGCLGFKYYTYAAGLIYAGQRLLGWKPDTRPLSITNIPDEFYFEYSGQRLDHVDPVLKFAMGTQLPGIWSKIYDFCPLGKAEKQLIGLSHDFQMYQGVVFPIHGPGNDFGVVSFSTPNDALPLCIPESVISVLTFLLHKLHARLRCRFAHASPLETLALSRREIDVLLWTTEGKSAWEIGKILTISERTVEQYLNSARQKLGVSTKSAAVAKLVTTHYKEIA